MSSKVTIGADGNIPGSAVVAVALHKAVVVLDPSAEAKLKDIRGPPGSAVAASVSEETSDPTHLRKGLDEECTRAVMFSMMIRLLKSKSHVRPEAVRLLCDMLNKNIVPRVNAGHNNSTLGVARALAGGERCLHESSSVKAALEKAGLKPLPLTQQEIDSMTFTSSGVAAIGVLALETAKDMAPLVDCVAALSCEVLHAHLEPFNDVHHDTNRPHKGACSVAENLRTLLEASKLAGSRNAKDAVKDEEFLRCTPSIHGAFRDQAAAMVAPIRVEFNSSESGPHTESSKCTGPTSTASIQGPLNALRRAAMPIVQNSSARLQKMADAPAGLGLQKNLLPAETSSSSTQGVAVLVEESADCARNFENLEFSSCDMEVALKALEAMETMRRQLSRECVVALQGIEILRAAKLKPKKSPQENLQEKAAEGKQPYAAVDEKMKDMKIDDKKDKKKGKEKKEKEKEILGRMTREFRKKIIEMANFEIISGDNSACLEACQRVHNALNPHDKKLRDTIDGFLDTSHVHRKPKIAKGTRDYAGAQMVIRERAFRIITDVFKRHGAIQLDTPVFELKETLTGKYGEDSKLIYDLADQGGEMLALRYDLTVPFARYVAMNGIGEIKRYHIARVYRRDNPAMNRGRFREFYQCDIDIAGEFGRMQADAEILQILTETLDELSIGDYVVKINHRRILDAVLAICGVPASKFRPICSAIDKLDKEPWSAVKDEMVNEKGLPEESADQIEKFVMHKGGAREMYEKLTSQNMFGDNKDAREALEDMRLLFDYLDAFGCLNRLSFDLSLARGLDYYTGIIYETVMVNVDGVGSIAAGGRYDNLVGMFGNKQVPCVGVSVGIERVFAIMERNQEGTARKNHTTVYVASAGKGMVLERLKLCKLLWDGKFAAEYMLKDNPNMDKQLTYVLENQIPFVCIIGETEVKEGTVQVKDMAKKTQDTVPRAELIDYLSKKNAELK